MLFAAVFVVHLTSPNVMIADSRRAVAVAQSIVHDGTIALDRLRDEGRLRASDYDVVAARGHVYPRFPWAVSLFAVPVVAAYDGAHAIGIGPGVEAKVAEDGSDWQFQAVVAAAVVAAATLVVWAVALAGLAAEVADERRRRRLALLVALVFSFGTPAWSTASRSLWQHGPSMLWLSVACLLAVRSRTRPETVRWLGLPLAAAYATRPTNAIPLAAFTLWALARHRRQFPAYLAGAAAVLAVFAAVNLASYGTLLPPYYSAQRLGGTPHLLEALAGNLVSPARGLLVYSPVAVLALAGLVVRARARRIDGLDVVLAGCVAAHWVAISSFVHWWGGNSYGPRLFSDMVPFLTVLSLPAVGALARGPCAAGARRTAAVAVAGCALLAAGSVLVNLPGAYLPATWCWNVVPDDIDRNPDRLWDLRRPQFLAGAGRLLRGPDRGGAVTRAGVLKLGCAQD